MLANFHIAAIVGLMAIFGLVNAAQLKNPLVKQTKRWFFHAAKCDSSRPGYRRWANNWDGKMHFSCPKHGTISSIYSIWRSCKRDRIWSFSCRRIDGAVQSHSNLGLDWNNEWDRPVFQMCDNNGYICGLQSEHDNKKEDRRFKFQCCTSKKYKTMDCSTKHLNAFQQELKFKLPRRFFVLTGLYSYHRNDKEDRVWFARICRLKRCG